MIRGRKKYENKKAYQVITSESDTITTNCTSISFSNVGTVSAFFECDGITLELEAGMTWNHSNEPEVVEVTLYERIYFADGPGTKKVMITREYVNETL